MTDSDKLRTCPTLLFGKFLKLESFKQDDVSERYLSWLNDSEVNRFLEVRHKVQTADSALEYVQSFEASEEKYMWAIRTIPDEEFIGTSTLRIADRIHGSAELGILIGERTYWGGTTAAEVLSLMIDFGFGALGLRRLVAGTYARHWGMNLVYKELGFTREGTLRSAIQLEPDEFIDGYRWGLLADEWFK